MRYETRIKLAGHSIRVCTLFPETGEFLREYRTEDPPEFEAVIAPEDIERERRKSEAEDRREGIPVRHFADPYLETLAVYRKIAERMPACDILLFHGSVIAVDGDAYLFTAKSGTGKSTHARLWREYFGDRAVMINDDKPLLRITENGVTAYGTPWDGKHRLSTNTSAPLKGLCILERAAENRIQRIVTSEEIRSAYPEIVQQTYRPGDPTAAYKTMELIDRLMQTVSIYRLYCNQEPEAARIAYEGMKGTEYEIKRQLHYS